MAQSRPVDRNIVFLGTTGSGKSTLGNVLARQDDLFAESSGIASKTKSVHAEIVEVFYDDRPYRLRLVDTIGLWDTDVSQEKVLLELAKLSTVCEGGIHQIFFVTKDKFTKQEMASFNIFRTVLLNPDAIGFTTVVRTRCERFQEPSEVRDLKEELERLCPDIKGAKKFLAVDNTTVHSGNPSWRERREKGREIVLSHIILNCVEPYNPDQLQFVQERVRNHVSEEQRLEKKVEKLEARVEEQKKSAEATEAANKTLCDELNAIKQQHAEAKKRIEKEMRNEKIWGLVLEVGRGLATSLGPAIASGNCVIQ